MQCRLMYFFLLSLAATRVVLVDDIPGLESHGGVSIDSTRNGMSHIVQKIRQKEGAFLNSSLSSFPMYPHHAYLPPKTPIPPPTSIHRIRETTRYRYIIPTPQIAYRSSYLAPYHIDKKPDMLMENLHSAQKEYERRESYLLSLSSKKEALQNSLARIAKEHDTIRYSIKITRSELESIQIELENLKAKLKDLIETSENFERKKYKIESKLKRIQHTLDSSSLDREESRKELERLKREYEATNMRYLGGQRQYVQYRPVFERPGSNKYT